MRAIEPYTLKKISYLDASLDVISEVTNTVYLQPPPFAEVRVFRSCLLECLCSKLYM